MTNQEDQLPDPAAAAKNPLIQRAAARLRAVARRRAPEGLTPERLQQILAYAGGSATQPRPRP